MEETTSIVYKEGNLEKVFGDKVTATLPLTVFEKINNALYANKRPLVPGGGPFVGIM